VGAAAGTLQATRAAMRVRNVCSSVDDVVNGLSSRCRDVLCRISISGAYIVIRRVGYHSDVWVGSRGGLTAANDGSSVPSLEYSSASQGMKTGAVLFESPFGDRWRDDVIPTDGAPPYICRCPFPE
jgi:hypothetical protein